MRLSSAFLVLVTAAATVAACGGKPPAEQPAPVAADTTGDGARARARQDSIDAANRARAEADRLAREAADRQAALDRAAAERATLTRDLAAVIHFDFD